MEFKQTDRAAESVCRSMEGTRVTKKNNLYLTKHIKKIVKRVEKEDQEKKDTHRYLKAGVKAEPLDLNDLVVIANICRKGLEHVMK